MANIFDVVYNGITRTDAVVEEMTDGRITLVPVVKTEDGYEKAGEPYIVPEETFDDIFTVIEKAPARTPETGEFTCQGGKLFLNGKAVETGTLHIEKVLNPAVGGVYLIVTSLKKTDDGQDLHDLFFYNMYEDKFNKLAAGYKVIRAVYEKEDVTGFLLTGEYIETIEAVNGDNEYDEEETEMKAYNMTFENFRVYRSGREIFRDVVSLAVPTETVEVTKTLDGDDVIILTTSKGTETAISADGEKLEVPTPERDGKRTMFTLYTFSEKEDKYGDMRLRIFGNVVKVNGRIVKILAAPDGNFVLVTDAKEVVHTNLGYFKRVAKGSDVVAAVERYPHPLWLEVDSDPVDTTIFTFADDSYGVCTIKVTKTRDRGFVTEITTK